MGKKVNLKSWKQKIVIKPTQKQNKYNKQTNKTKNIPNT